MFVCPNCSTSLNRTRRQYGSIWVCSSCGGQAASISLLRHFVQRQPLNELWQAALRGTTPTRMACPACRRAMTQVSMPSEGMPFILDVCKRCQFIWFDCRELETLPVTAPKSEISAPSREVPLAARELIAEYQPKEISERARKTDYGDQPPESWKCVPGVFGLPVEYANPPLKCLPWVTWICAVLVLMISVISFGDVRSAAQRFGFIPSELGRMGGLTLISSFFLHANVGHLVGNLYFLFVFGDNVEDFIGSKRFVLLLIAATLGGSFLHFLVNPSSTTPCVGASGGISGIIAFYAMQFPHAKLGLLFRLSWFFRWVSMRAYVALILWVLLQSPPGKSPAPPAFPPWPTWAARA